jgi:hypothetical protein
MSYTLTLYIKARSFKKKRPLDLVSRSSACMQIPDDPSTPSEYYLRFTSVLVSVVLVSWRCTHHIHHLTAYAPASDDTRHSPLTLSTWATLHAWLVTCTLLVTRVEFTARTAARGDIGLRIDATGHGNARIGLARALPESRRRDRMW